MAGPSREEINAFQKEKLNGQQKKIDKLNNETYRIVLKFQNADGKLQAFEHCILIDYKSIPCFKDQSGNYYPVTSVLTFCKEF